MRRAFAHLMSASIALGVVAVSIASCSIGEGNGDVRGFLNVRDCWTGPFDLQPNFFAAVPYRDNLQLRIQNGGDFQTFSDGVSILIDNVQAIRQHTDASGAEAGKLGVPLVVSLPAGVTPPGVPITPNPNPAGVHLALYLQRTCRTQDVALYAIDSVTLNGAGGCDPGDGGQPVLACPGSGVGGAVPPATADGGTDAGVLDASAGDAGGAPSAPIGRSTITFDSLFDNYVDETRADQRRNKGTFKVYLADPREMCPGGIGPPPPCRGYLEGSFDFYFERGRPAQPFP